MNRDNAAVLARVPVGLMVTNEIELGPYLLAFTPHSVLAAPCHIRLAASILAGNAALALPAAQARQVIADTGVDYVVTCGPAGPIGITGDQTAASLWGCLKDGGVPDWLSPMPGLDGRPFAVYRVRR